MRAPGKCEMSQVVSCVALHLVVFARIGGGPFGNGVTSHGTH